ncbi:retrovirus-related pol polyprotein from transposon TNT 1-94 [Tanacetum coccineum]
MASFSQGLRNANHTQTLDLADIYGRFVYEYNLISRRYSDTKKALITTSLDSPISTAFFSNNIVLDFQENSNERTKVSNDEEETRVQVLIALADDELSVGNNHARNGEWIDITMKKCLQLIELSSDPKSSKESSSEPQTPLSLLKNLQGASLSSEIMKSKAKPYLPCTHCSFNDHRPNDCRNYPECEICGSYDHFTSEHNRVIQIRGRVLAESSQSSESSIGRHIREPIWYLDSGCSRSMTGVKSYLHKYVEQPGLKMVENQNDVKVKQIKTDNETKFRNTKLESFCDEKGISQNFSYPYTPKQNGVAERKNKTLIEAARTMLNGSVLSKHFWNEADRIAC